MKTILFFLLTGNFLWAQHPDLINTNWQITKIVSEVMPAQLPPPMPYQQVTSFSATSPQLKLSFFNIVSADLIYTGQEVFTVNSKTCTYADYWGDNGEVNQFFDILCEYFNPGNFYYFIENNGDQKTLVISTPTFKELHFTSVNLATKESDLSQYIIGPNPVQSVLTVQNSKGINSVQLFDLSGKSVYELKNGTVKSLNIDMQNFKTGTYLIKLNNDKTYKIIKK